MHTTAKVAGSALAAAVTAGLLAAGAALGTHAPATAAAAPPKPKPVATKGAAVTTKVAQSLPHTSLMGRPAKRIALDGWSADSVWHNSIAWGANVRIYSGRYGAYTRCTDGSVRYGPLQGPGYWKFGGNCLGAGNLTGFGVYGSG
ncbi:hypothetical protein [Actinomadura sp. K4S16]|uniref:hypothetical protein n=1 Tax=Actinomadura sp. K4S16 TaxID=1316147 RepID=UPI0011EEC894|nr:hypothetical protein [Actinomadura sp. K4S16]